MVRIASFFIKRMSVALKRYAYLIQYRFVEMFTWIQVWCGFIFFLIEITLLLILFENLFEDCTTACSRTVSNHNYSHRCEWTLRIRYFYILLWKEMILFMNIHNPCIRSSPFFLLKKRFHFIFYSFLTRDMSKVSIEITLFYLP